MTSEEFRAQYDAILDLYQQVFQQREQQNREFAAAVEELTGALRGARQPKAEPPAASREPWGDRQPPMHRLWSMSPEQRQDALMGRASCARRRRNVRAAWQRGIRVAR